MTGRRRFRICVRGVVQGVGFRPFVYTCAASLGLTGSVRNDSAGDETGVVAALKDAFQTALKAKDGQIEALQGHVVSLQAEAATARKAADQAELDVDRLESELEAEKIARAEALFSSEAKQRFVREAQTLAALRHPNIIPIYEFGESGGLPYIVEELCDGPNLAVIDGRMVKALGWYDNEWGFANRMVDLTHILGGTP